MLSITERNQLQSAMDGSRCDRQTGKTGSDTIPLKLIGVAVLSPV